MPPVTPPAMATGACPVGLFVDEARAYLARWDLNRARRAISGAAGHWHPTGFMVFHTGDHFAGRSVRVHAWTATRPAGSARHPAHHTHMWHLASKVLAGTYRERTVDMEPDPDGPFLEYRTAYRSITDASLVPSGRRLRIAAERSHSTTAGDIHWMEAGDWHATRIRPTRIRPDGPVVTVMVTSEPVLPYASVAGRTPLDEERIVRAEVTADDVEQLISLLAEVERQAAPAPR